MNFYVWDFFLVEIGFGWIFLGNFSSFYVRFFFRGKVWYIFYNIDKYKVIYLFIDSICLIIVIGYRLWYVGCFKKKFKIILLLGYWMI